MKIGRRLRSIETKRLHLMDVMSGLLEVHLDRHTRQVRGLLKLLA